MKVVKMKKSIIEEMKNSSIIDQIILLNEQFIFSDKNIEKLKELNSPKQVVPLLFLLGRINREEKSGKYENLLIKKIKEIKATKEGIELFIDELLLEGKFEDGSATNMMKELIYGLEILSKAGVKWLVDVLLKVISSKKDEYLAITAIELIEDSVHFLDFEPYLEAIEKSENRYLKKKALENIKRIGEEGIIVEPEVNIRIINGIKGEMENSDEEIRWEASKTISVWMEGLKMYIIGEEELEEMGLEGKEEIERKIIEIGGEFAGRVIEYFEKEGTEEEKEIIREHKERRKRIEEMDGVEEIRKEFEKTKKRIKEREKKLKEILGREQEIRDKKE
jgi:hypothetical protein